jgi:hypothetical protein
MFELESIAGAVVADEHIVQDVTLTAIGKGEAVALWRRERRRTREGEEGRGRLGQFKAGAGPAASELRLMGTYLLRRRLLSAGGQCGIGRSLLHHLS